MKFLRHAINRLFRLIEHSKWVFLTLLLSVALGILLHIPPAKATIQDEYRVKAAFIYNFIAFTQWPDFAELNTFTMCIYGKDYFKNEINALEERTINSIPIQTKRLNQLGEIRQCQALFISRSQYTQLTNILDSIQELPILTIADSPDAAEKGVMINMHLEQNKVKFEINLKSARNVGLNISSRLLQLATQVYQ